MNNTLLSAAKKAMGCLTEEQEREWRISQSSPNAPYYFLLNAITTEENTITNIAEEHSEFFTLVKFEDWE